MFNFLSFKSIGYRTHTLMVSLLFTGLVHAESDIDRIDPETDIDRLQNTIENYHQNIKQLEIEHGVYHPGIGENLLSLGIAYKTLSQHDAALDSFQRALQNHRINYGLHNEEQISIVKNLIDVNYDKGDWQALNKNYDYLNWLYRRVYGHQSEDLIAPLETLAQAKLKLYYHLHKEADLEQLTSTEVLFNKIVELSAGKKGYLNNKLNALYGISLANFQVASVISSTRDLVDVRDVRRRNANYEEALRHDVMFTVAYNRGKQALEQIVEEHKSQTELSKESEVMALTYLGDWYLLFNHRLSAKKKYIEANKILAELDFDNQNTKSLFTKPVQLPIFAMPFVERGAKIDLDETNHLTVSMDITANGTPRNIEIMDSTLEDKNYLHRRIKDILYDTRFRPRFENGKPVLTKNLSMKYIYPQSGIK